MIEEIFITRSKGEWIDCSKRGRAVLGDQQPAGSGRAPQAAALDMIQPVPGDDFSSRGAAALRSTALVRRSSTPRRYRRHDKSFAAGSAGARADAAASARVSGSRPERTVEPEKPGLQRLHDEGEFVDLLAESSSSFQVLEDVDAVHDQHDLMHG